MSRIYKPHRTLGLVSNGIPAVCQTRGTEHFVTTCIGKSFHTYNCKKLALQFVSPLHDGDITTLSGHKDFLFTAVENMVYSWIRGKLVRTYEGHSSAVDHLLPFGDHIISIADNRRMVVHDIETGDVYADVRLQAQTTAITHPATYINKVLLGTKNGVLELWNVKTLKLIHQFQSLGSEITVMTQSPGIDVMGIGLKNGKILLHNIKYDETVMKFYQDWGCVTSLSFRSDGTPLMVSGSVEGHLAVWDLDKQELHSTIHEAHQSTISTSVFLRSQPLLLTSGSDNAIKIWIFDGPGGTARLLKDRSGHRAAPTVARFYGTHSETVLSAGYDRSVRMFCVIKDERSRELSQGSIESKSKKIHVSSDSLKLPPVTALAAEEIRERDWCNVITAHCGSRDVKTWSTQSGVLSDKTLTPKLETIVVTAVGISVCGNIGIVGYNSGHLTAFNLQSAINRGLFGKVHAHRGKVVGVASDSINKHVYSIGTDSNLKIWDLTARTELHSIPLPASPTSCSLYRDSNLLSVSLESNVVVIVDVDTHTIVREFSHSDKIVDMCYSKDGKYLVVSTGDHIIRQWDLITARLIDCFKTPDLVTSVSLSDEYLVTTSANELGLLLWANRTLYETIELKPLPDNYEPQLANSADERLTIEMEVEEEEPRVWKSLDQISEELVTLSSVSKARWTALCNLDIIKKRNKPKAPLTGPKAAPFFLATTKELVPKFVVQQKAEQDEPMKPLRSEESEFQSWIMSDKTTSQIISYLDSLPLSSLDLELQSLAPPDGGHADLVERFIEIMSNAIETKQYYDVVQAYLNVFLKYNRQYLVDTPHLHDKLRKLKTVQSESWSDLHHKLQKCLCVTTFIKNPNL